MGSIAHCPGTFAGAWGAIFSPKFNTMQINSLKELKAIQEELDCLSKKLFGEDKFVVFSEEEKQSAEYKRYDELMSAKMNYLAPFFYSKNPYKND